MHPGLVPFRLWAFLETSGLPQRGGAVAPAGEARKAGVALQCPGVHSQRLSCVPTTSQSPVGYSCAFKIIIYNYLRMNPSGFLQAQSTSYKVRVKKNYHFIPDLTKLDHLKKR